MDDVSSDIDWVVSSQSSWLAGKGVCLSEHHSSLSNDVFAFPDHGHHGAREHVLDQSWEEGSWGQVSIVIFEEFLTWLQELEAN